MRIILTILLIVFLNSFSKAQFTAIPDFNFELKLMLEGYDGGVVDGFVPTANIDTITYLDIMSAGISDLTGIEDFAALKEIYFGGNTIDTAIFTQNNQLEIIMCQSSSVSYLDISQNSLLKYLDCSNNYLTSLDISQNQLLASVRCSWNNLTSLNTTPNLSLYNLRCRFNQLTNLDLTQNPNLYDLMCEDNLLTSLNLTQNSKLKYLDCPNNQLSSLNVLGCDSLKSIVCEFNQLTNLDVSGLFNLTNLQCSENLLTSINMSGDSLLWFLQCRNNQLTSLDVLQNPGLIHVDCQGNNLFELDFTLNPILTELNCSYNNLTCLNLKNGNSTSRHPNKLSTLFNYSLSCIEIDNTAFQSGTYWYINPQANFSNNCTGPCTVGIEESLIINTRIYPNPTTGSININLGEIKPNLTTTITNQLGQVISTQQYKSTDFITLEIDGPSGIYFMQVTTESGEFITKKIVKE